MAIGQLAGFFRRLRLRVGSPEGGDAPLLERFAATRDESAFAALVERHGPMVLGVCRRVLGTDADDAFQATFLVLARSAASVRRRESVGGWLYRVAYRVAWRLRRAAERRRGREREAILMPQTQPPSEQERHELRELIEVELDRLPEKYRTPLVLCYLEGRTNEEVARVLGHPPGTMSGLLSRGRELLRRALARRGLAVGVAVVAAALEGARAEAVPDALHAATVRSAVSFASGPAAAAAGTAQTVAEEMLRTLFMNKMKTLIALAAVVVLGVSVPFILDHSRAADPPGAKAGPDAPAAKKAEAPPSSDPWKLVRTIGSPAPLASLAAELVFTPDGKTLGGMDGQSLRLWDVASGRERTALSVGDGGLALFFAPDGKHFGTANYRGIRIWDAVTKEVLADFAWKLPKVKLAVPDGVVFPRADDIPLVEASVTTLSFSRNGKALAVAVSDGSVRVWDLTTLWEKGQAPEKEAAVFKGEMEQTALRLAFSADGKRLAAAGIQGIVRVWDLGQKKEIARLTGEVKPEDGITMFGLCFSPDGRLVAAGDPGGLIVWELASQKRLAEVKLGDRKAFPQALPVPLGGGGGIAPPAIAPPQRAIPEKKDDEARKDNEKKDEKKDEKKSDDEKPGVAPQPEEAIDAVIAFAFSADGKTMATGKWDGSVMLWDLAGLWEKAEAPKTPTATLPAPKKKQDDPQAFYDTQVSALAFSPDGKTLAVASLDGSIRFWQAGAKK